MADQFRRLPNSEDYELIGSKLPAGYDEDEEVMKVALLVWNASTFIWERMKQPTLEVGDLTVSLSDVEKLLAGHYWKDQRFDYTSGNLDYKGLSITHKAATDAGDLWYVWKFTWASGNLTRIEGPINCNWDDITGEAWA